MTVPDPDPVATTGKAQRKRGFWSSARETVIILVIALVIAAIVRMLLIQAFYVPSASMESTLLPNDRILASKITTRFTGPQRGEIMVFTDPGGWLPPAPQSSGGVSGAIRSALAFIGLLPSDSGDDLVKRVIGVAGDRVQCCDAQGHIVLNGVALVEDYIIGPTDQVHFDITVPPGTFFVMGDNRGNSLDSRYHLDQDSGGVPIGNAVGRAFLTVWPVTRFAFHPIPEIFGNPALS